MIYFLFIYLFQGFPIHMNLAVHQRNIYDEQKTAVQTIQRLKEQNHALTEVLNELYFISVLLQS